LGAWLASRSQNPGGTSTGTGTGAGAWSGRAVIGHAEVLLDADSPYHAGPLAVILAGIARVLPQLLAA